MEVINAIMTLKGYNNEQIIKSMETKRNKKRAFKGKIFLEYVDEEKRNLEEEEELNKSFRNKK